MNSLVVLFSVVALAAAKPSGLLDAEVISYGVPAIASYSAPAAVSQQSRIDIKSSPAVIATAAVAPVTRTFISEPVAVAAPTYVAAPAAVSHQSRLDIKSTPAVIDTVATAPIAFSAPIATAAIAPTLIKSAAIATPAIGATAFVNTAYTSPAFLRSAELVAPTYLKSAEFVAPTFLKSPEFIAPTLSESLVKTESVASTEFTATSDSAPSVPLDTPEVIAARNAHFEAKAIASGHLIRKRSAPFFGAPVISTYSTPIVSSLIATHPVSSYSVPLVSAPLVTKTYGVHAW